MKTKRVPLIVGRAHSIAGERGEPNECAVALAIQDQLGVEFPQGFGVNANAIEWPDGVNVTWLPKILEEAVEVYDTGAEFSPGIYVINVPEQYASK